LARLARPRRDDLAHLLGDFRMLLEQQREPVAIDLQRLDVRTGPDRSVARLAGHQRNLAEESGWVEVTDMDVAAIWRLRQHLNGAAPHDVERIAGFALAHQGFAVPELMDANGGQQQP